MSVKSSEMGLVEQALQEALALVLRYLKGSPSSYYPLLFTLFDRRALQFDALFHSSHSHWAGTHALRPCSDAP